MTILKAKTLTKWTSHNTKKFTLIFIPSKKEYKPKAANKSCKQKAGKKQLLERFTQWNNFDVCLELLFFKLVTQYLLVVSISSFYWSIVFAMQSVYCDGDFKEFFQSFVIKLYSFTIKLVMDSLGRYKDPETLDTALILSTPCTVALWSVNLGQTTTEELWFQLQFFASHTPWNSTR